MKARESFNKKSSWILTKKNPFPTPLHHHVYMSNISKSSKKLVK